MRRRVVISLVDDDAPLRESALVVGSCAVKGDATLQDIYSAFGNATEFFLRHLDIDRELLNGR